MGSTGAVVSHADPYFTVTVGKSVSQPVTKGGNLFPLTNLILHHSCLDLGLSISPSPGRGH